MPHLGHDVDLLASLSLTHVQFNTQDPISYVFAYITLIPLAIIIFYASVVLSRREIAIILMGIGQLANEIVNAILKEYFQIARPNFHLGLGTGYGMPSSHAQFVWYFTAFGAIYLLRHIQLSSSIWKGFYIFAMILLSLIVCQSRVYLGYHSSGQVFVGSIVGIIFGCIWYQLVELIRSYGYIDRLIDTSLAKWVYLKDMRQIDNVIEWEYQNWVKEISKKKK